MKKYICEKCGKELINLSINNYENYFWCDDCDIEYLIDVDEDCGEDNYEISERMF